MYGATCVNCSILKTCWPATMQRSVPSGTLSIFWIMPIVPTRCTSSGPGSSISRS